MLDYVYGHDEVVGRFVSDLIPHFCGRRFGPEAKTIGVIDEQGRLMAGVVFHNWDVEAGIIEISGASLSPRFLTRETIRRQYEFPFLQVGCQMVVQRQPADNERLLRQLAAFDYMFVKVPRMFGRDRDGVLALLTREAWDGNWFNQRYARHLVDAPLEEAA